MISKNGLVMNIEKNYAYIMTPDGEFLKIKIDKDKPLPVIGSEYAGEVLKNSSTHISKFKYAIAACLLFFILSLGGGAYAYYTPVSTVTISINPSIEFKLNRWNKVVSSHALNSDGEKILLELKTQNKPIDATLMMVINQAKTDKYINENYINMDKTIVINIVGKDVNLPNLKNQLSKDNLNVKIDSNGSTVFNKKNKKSDKALPKNSYEQDNNVNKNTNSNINKSTVNDDSSNVYKNDKSIDNSSKHSESNNTNSNPDTNSENNNKKDDNNTSHEKSDDKSYKANDGKTEKNHDYEKSNKHEKNKEK